MRKVGSVFFFLLFWLTLIAFFGGLLSTIINPKFFWPLAFLGLGFPVTFFLLVGFLIYWIVTKNKKFVLPLFLLIIGSFVVPTFFNYDFGKNPKDSAESIKVMSYNVRNFEVYDKENKEQKRDAIIRLIENQQPDILCLQEAIDRKTHIEFEEFGKQIGLPNYHFETGTVAKDGAKFGVAIVSKYPIDSISSYEFGSGGNVGTKAAINVNGTSVSVFNIHLESANIENNYYNYSGDEAEQASNKDYFFRAKRVSRQLRNAFQNRSYQANLIRQKIGEATTPVIVCGDFNDTPVSYSYSRVKNSLHDTFQKGDFGLGVTYPALPFLRIDHILVSDEFDILSHEIIKKELSDHYPVISEIKLKE